MVGRYLLEMSFVRNVIALRFLLMIVCDGWFSVLFSSMLLLFICILAFKRRWNNIYCNCHVVTIKSIKNVQVVCFPLIMSWRPIKCKTLCEQDWFNLYTIALNLFCYRYNVTQNVYKVKGFHRLFSHHT